MKYTSERLTYCSNANTNSFVCCNCKKVKTAKKYAIVDGNESMKICNGCYGEILRHEDEAESAKAYQMGLNHETLTKLFAINDFVEVECDSQTVAGEIIDIAPRTLALKDAYGAPVIISLRVIRSCKKISSVARKKLSGDESMRHMDKVASISQLFSEVFNRILNSEKYIANSRIRTNATILSNSVDGVRIETDEKATVLVAKSFCVGYSWENATEGRRVFFLPSGSQLSQPSAIFDMSFEDLRERLDKAVKSKPSPKYAAIRSIASYLAVHTEYGLEECLASLSAILDEVTALSNLPLNGVQEKESIVDKVVKKRIDVEELPKEEYDHVVDYIKSSYAQSELSASDLIREAREAVSKLLGQEIKRAGIKKIVYDLSLGQDAHEQLYIKPNASLMKYFVKYHNGMLQSNKRQIKFTDDVIIDDDLKKKFIDSRWWDESYSPISVVCFYNNKNEALVVFRPNTLANLKKKEDLLRQSGEIKLADLLATFIQNQVKRSEDVTPNAELLSKAREQRLIKNFEKAEELFLEVIDRRYNLDVAVRDLATMYQEYKGYETAVSLLLEYKDIMSDKMKVYNMLYTFYTSSQHYDEAITVMEEAKLLFSSNSKSDRKNIESIEKKIEFANRLKTESSSKVEVRPTNALSYIPSALLRNDVLNLGDSALAFVSNKSYEDKIKLITRRIDELKNSPELPSYYLALVSLLGEREGDEQEKINMISPILARYCKARARNFLLDGNLTVAKEYLLQGTKFSSVLPELSLLPQLYSLLLLCLCGDSNEILHLYQEGTISYSDILKSHSIEETDENFSVLSEIFSLDSADSRKIIRALYESKHKTWLCEELEIDSNVDPQSYVKAIQLISKDALSRKKDFEEFLSSLVAKKDLISISKEFISSQRLSSKDVFASDHLLTKRINDIANDVVDLSKIQTFDDYDEKCNNSIQQIQTVIQNISQIPTAMASLYILPVCLKIKDLLTDMKDEKRHDSLPNITIKSIEDAHRKTDGWELQFSIANESGASKATNCVLKILSVNGKSVENLSCILENPLGGGQEEFWTVSYRSTEQVGDSLLVEYNLTYKDIMSNMQSNQGELSIPIHTGRDYVDFENRYEAHVKSNAVTEKSMFKGRDSEIDIISRAVEDEYRGYVLYGQKRSGKSSVLYHIAQRLRADKVAFPVSITMGNSIIQDSSSKKETLANLFYMIASETLRSIKEVDRGVYKERGLKIVPRQNFEQYPEECFSETMDLYREIINEDLNYQQDKIVLIIDEFTTLYYHILGGKLPREIMSYWKAILDQRRFSVIFAGQDAMPRLMNDFENVFASMDPHELSYIDRNSAIELIEEPIWDHENNTSRYTKEAVERILDLTACSPFYIMILCSELVKDARARKRVPITAPDVDAVMQKMVCNESSISKKDFDNLISCGESEFDLIRPEDSMRILKDIAIKSRNSLAISRDEIDVFDKHKSKEIIDELLRRGVLERMPDSDKKVKIKVGLFKKWLLNHE